MPQVVRNLPQRPLRSAEVGNMRDTVHAHCVSQEPDTDAVYLLCVTNDTIRALGYDPRIDMWVQFFETDGQEFEPTRYNELVTAMRLWVDGQYWHEVRTGKYKVNLPEPVDAPAEGDDEDESERDVENLDSEPGEDTDSQEPEDTTADQEPPAEATESLPSARSMSRMDIDKEAIYEDGK